MPGEGDEAGDDLRESPAQVKPGGSGQVVVLVDPVADEGCDRADEQEQHQAGK